MRIVRIWFAFVLVGVLGAACSSNTSPDRTAAKAAASEPSDREEPSKPEEQDEAEGASAPAIVEPSPISDRLDAFTITPWERADPENVPEAARGARAYWYQADGRYVVVYAGLGLDEIGPQCASTSLKGPDGEVKSVTNAPTHESACDHGLPEGATLEDVLPKDGFGLRVCENVLIYGTDIGIDAEGVLFAAISVRLADGSDGSLLAGAVVEPERTPEIVPDADSYTLPEKFPGDDVTVTC